MLTGPAQRVPRKRSKSRRKLQNLTFLAVNFSCKSDKYSKIYKLLKIKFFWTKFQKFRNFLKINKFFGSKYLLETERNWNSSQNTWQWSKTAEIDLSNHALFIQFRQIFACIITFLKHWISLIFVFFLHESFKIAELPRVYESAVFQIYFWIGPVF